MNRLSQLFLFLLGVIIALPAVQQYKAIIHSKGLHGAIHTSQLLPFTFETWWNGTYQSSAAAYLKENVGFRADFVRLKNQYDYTLFNKVNSTLVVGKNNYLFEKAYIDFYGGFHYIGDETIEGNVSKLKYVIEELRKFDTELIFMIAPNKARYYAEFLPAADQQQAQPNNYDGYVSYLNKHQVPYIDFMQYFMEQKDLSEHTLIPKYGAHWSIYGATQVQDSLLELMQSFKKDTLASFEQVDVEVDQEARFTDADLSPLLNLINSWRSPGMSYPILQFNSSNNRPKVLSISDSFYWNFYHTEVLQNCFSEDSRYWYYGDKIFGKDAQSVLGSASELNKLQMTKEADFVLIICNGTNLHDFPFRFIEETYTALSEDGI